MAEEVRCPLCGEPREIHDAYLHCPWFTGKIDHIAEVEEMEPLEVMNSGRWKETVPDERIR